MKVWFVLLFIISSAECFAVEISVGKNGEYQTISEALEQQGEKLFINILDDLHIESGIVIRGNVVITGTDPEKTVIAGSSERGSASDRIFLVTESGRLELKALTVCRGKPSAVPLRGGGIANEGFLRMTDCVLADNDAVYGAGLFTRGHAELYRCVISGNRTFRAPLEIIRTGVGCMGSGAGIKTESECTLIIENCAFIDNYSVRSGGGLYVACEGNVSIKNSLFYGNSCAKRGGGLSSKGNIVLEHVTITRNQSVQRGSGFCNMGRASVRATLLADNSYGDFANIAAHGVYSEGFLTANSGNLCSDGSLEGAEETDARLKPLRYVSGSVPFVGIGWFSPARNALTRTGDYNTVTDMRGVLRDSMPDIGAYEFRLFAGQRNPEGCNYDVNLK